MIQELEEQNSSEPFWLYFASYILDIELEKGDKPGMPKGADNNDKEPHHKYVW